MEVRLCTFGYVPGFMAKTQSPLVHNPRFEEFTVPSSMNFVDGDRDEMLLCPKRVLKKYLGGMEQYCPACANLFISVTKKKKWVSPNTILFWM